MQFPFFKQATPTFKYHLPVHLMHSGHNGCCAQELMPIHKHMKRKHNSIGIIWIGTTQQHCSISNDYDSSPITNSVLVTLVIFNTRYIISKYYVSQTYRYPIWDTAIIATILKYSVLQLIMTKLIVCVWYTLYCNLTYCCSLANRICWTVFESYALLLMYPLY